MNKHLFFLLTSCAFIACVDVAHAADIDLGNVIGPQQEWENIVGGQYGNLVPEQLQQLVNNGYSIDSLENFIETADINPSKEFQDQVSQIGNAISESSSNIMGKPQEFVAGNVAEVQNAISSLNSSMDNFGALSDQIDNSLKGVQDDAFKMVTGDGVLNDGILNDTMNVGSQVGAQLTGAMEVMNNPQSLLTMGLGYVGWDQITNLSMGAAMDAVTDFLSVPNVGIPVMESGFTASNAADKAAKAATGEVNNKVSDEKQKQVDAVGARPSTPVGEEVANSEGADENPSLDSCPALMASYPRQSNKAYDFLKINYLDAKQEKQHAIAKKSMAEAVPYVESLFFLKPDDLTTKNQDEMRAKRDEYLSDMVAEVLTLNIGVQQNLVEDAMSIPTAPTSGCNLIDDLNVSTMIMISTAKQTMADIALQIQLLEFEGIQRIVNADIGLLDKPEEDKNKDNK